MTQATKRTPTQDGMHLYTFGALGGVFNIRAKSRGDALREVRSMLREDGLGHYSRSIKFLGEQA
jgi:hypothetical protein